MIEESVACHTTIVLLHGAGTGAWVWERVQASLQTSSLALDIPCRVAGATPDGCAAAIVSELDRRGVAEVVMVLHSLSGVLAAGLARRLGPRLKSCVFVASVIPPNGGAFVDALGFINRSILRILFRLNPRGLKPSAKMIRAAMCNDLSETDAELVIARYAAEWPGLYLTPMGGMPSGIRMEYVRLLRDQSVTLKQQGAMITHLQSPRIDSIDAGHLAMLSRPTELAQILDTEAHDVNSP